MRAKRSILSFGSGAAVTSLATLVGLVTTPFLLEWLGDERFGAFRALVEWTGYLTILELGLGGALLAVLPRALSGGAEDVANAMRHAIRAYAIVAALTLLGGLALVALAPWLVPVGADLRWELRVAAGIGAVGGLLTLATPFRALLESAQRGYVVNAWLLAQSVAIVGLTLLLAWLGWGLIGMATGTLIGSIVFAAGATVSACRRWPVLKTRPVGDSSKWGAALWKANWTTLVMNVCGRLAVLSDNIVIGLFLGPATVTPFFLTQRLIQVAGGQVAAIGSATWAGLADIYHSNDVELLRRRVLELSRLVIAIGGAALIAVVAYNGYFVRLWVGEASYAGDRLTILAGAVVILAGLFSLWGWVFRGAGIIQPLLPLSIATAVVNVGVSIGTTAGLGWIEGPLVGTFAAQVLVSAWAYPLLMRRHFGFSIRQLAGGLATPLASVLAMGIVAWILGRWYPPSGWWSLALMMAGTGIVVSIVMWFGVLSAGERSAWRARMAALRRRGAVEGTRSC